MREDLKAQNVNWNIPVTQVRNDAFGTVIKGAGNDDNLMTLIQRIFVEFLPESA
jgi:hypothetical protein